MVSLENQFEYWDRMASLKTFTHPIDFERFHSFVPEKARVLDFGCGYGRTCDELHRKGFRNITGVDSSEKMVRRGRKEYPHLILQTWKGNRFQCEAEFFDAVILFAVLTCIPTDTGQRTLMDEIHRVLAPEGILYISDYWLQKDKRNRSRYEAFQDKYKTYGVFELPEGAIVRHHEREWISSLLSDFKKLDMFDIEVRTMNGNVSSGFQYIGRKRGYLNG
jgi:SAM-dependent methyltransferase